jgi:deferrochelatase/peroxidase EfeB
MLGVGAGLDHVVAKEPRKAASGLTTPRSSRQVVPFYGSHQAGIATPAQDYLSFAAFDLTSDATEDLQRILEQWTAAAASLTTG